MKKHHKHLHMARRKMARIIDEIYTALLHYESREVQLNILREAEGLRLNVQADFSPEHIEHIQRMAELLQPAVRSAAMVEEYWELAGEDQYTSESELALVGQMADSAVLEVKENKVRIELYVSF